MSTTVETPKPEEQIDSAALISQRNAAEQARRENKEVPAKPVVEEVKKAAAEDQKDETPRLPRSVRREINRLREEAAEARGRLSAFEEMRAKPVEGVRTASADNDPEPQSKDFASDAEYQRALGRWDARQEAKMLIGKKEEEFSQSEQMRQYREHVDAMRVKASADAKKIPDYDAVAKEAAEDPDAIVVDWSKNPNLLGMIAESEVQAPVLYYLAKNQDELQKLLDLTPNLAKQLRYFARLEERAEKMYTPNDKEAAQASDKPKGESKDRSHPAEAPAGRNTSERDALKPRPSKEVEARGGSAPPEEPTPGSAAWMARRNQATGGR